MTAKSFSVRKSKWKMRAKNLVREVDEIARRYRRGLHISMTDLYGTGHRIGKLGERGEQLVGDSAHLNLNRRQQVINDFGSVCQLLETASKTLEFVVDQQGTPKVDFPTYIAPIRATSTIELPSGGALSDFVKLSKKMGEGRVEKPEESG